MQLSIALHARWYNSLPTWENASPIRLLRMSAELLFCAYVWFLRELQKKELEDMRTRRRPSFDGRFPFDLEMRNIFIKKIPHSIYVVSRSPIVHEHKTLLFYKRHHLIPKSWNFFESLVPPFKACHSDKTQVQQLLVGEANRSWSCCDFAVDTRIRENIWRVINDEKYSSETTAIVWRYQSMIRNVQLRSESFLNSPTRPSPGTGLEREWPRWAWITSVARSNFAFVSVDL